MDINLYQLDACSPVIAHFPPNSSLFLDKFEQSPDTLFP